MPAEKQAILEGAPQGQAIDFLDKDHFLKEDIDYCHIGYGVNADGTAWAANETFVSRGTVEMMDWWIPWNGMGSDMRFKTWDPEEHFFTRSDNVARLRDSSIPMNERLWGTVNTVLESIGGPKPMVARLHFMSPAKFGFDQQLIGSAKCQSIVCGGGGPAMVSHKYYETDGGLMIGSYFWVGWSCDDDWNIGRAPLDKMPVPPVAIAKLLYGHSIREMGQLAVILPDIYAEEKDNM